MSTSVPLQTRLSCVKRANGVCEHCKKPLVARAAIPGPKIRLKDLLDGGVAVVIQLCT